MSVVDEISPRLEEMNAAWASFDPKTIGQLYAEHCTVLMPGSTLSGRAAVEDNMQSWISSGHTPGEVKTLEVDGSGNIAFVRGTYSLTKDGKVLDASLEENRWKVARAGRLLNMSNVYSKIFWQIIGDR